MTDVPVTQLLPTHMSGRGPKLLEQGKDWVKMGGYVDFTADESKDERGTFHRYFYYYIATVSLIDL